MSTKPEAREAIHEYEAAAMRLLQGLNSSRKKGSASDKCGENHPSGAKAPLFFAGLNGTTKVVPFQNLG
jgi:hypothetical protein